MASPCRSRAMDGTQSCRYTNGTTGGDTYSNADVTLLTNAGLTDLGFSGTIWQNSNWNGTIYYDAGPSGPTLTLTGACPGPVTFDIAGATLPAGACGKTVQGVDLGSCTTTNSLVMSARSFHPIAEPRTQVLGSHFFGCHAPPRRSFSSRRGNGRRARATSCRWSSPR